MANIKLVAVAVYALTSCVSPALAQLSPLISGFEAAPATGDIGRGWLAVVRQYSGPGVYAGSYSFQGNPNAPAAGPQVSSIVTGQGGIFQGLKQLEVTSDYSNVPFHSVTGAFLETQVYQEQVVSAIDLNSEWAFSSEARRTTLQAPAVAQLFISLHDASGNLKHASFFDTSATSDMSWSTYSASIILDDAVVGDVVRFGFQTTAGENTPSGIIYDNVKFFPLVWGNARWNMDGRLIGASGIEVSGSFYEVTFEDGECAALFTGCDDSGDFVFNTAQLASEASQALLSQLFNNNPIGSYGLGPDLISGCLAPEECFIITPFGVNIDPSNYDGYYVVVRAPIFQDEVDSITLPKSLDTSSSFVSVYARWSIAQDGTINEVKVPINFHNLALLAFLMMVFYRIRQRQQGLL